MKEDSNLVVDIGNTRIKSGLVNNDQVSNLQFWEDLESIMMYLADKESSIIGSVKYSKKELQSLSDQGHMVFHREMPIPINIDYQTPETLGLDRLAAAVGAAHIYVNEPSLIIDFGSCITYDIIDAKKTFQGGIISPGLEMRLKAMHEYTANLPDLREIWSDYDSEFIGKSTKSCMVSGAVNGIIGEMKRIIDHFRSDFANLNVLATGGDASYFETNINTPIFVRPNLVMVGLNQILIYNNEDT